jgi:DNA-binding transcriptional regulator GbsR (MarR family)
VSDEPTRAEEQAELLDDLSEMRHDAREWTEREGHSTRDEQVAQLLDDRDEAQEVAGKGATNDGNA